jgi:hypothetical protein
MNFIRVPGANHFLNDGPVELLLNCLERCIPAPVAAFKLPALPALPALPDLTGWFGRKPAAPGDALSA